MEKLRSVLVTDRTQADVNAVNEKGTYGAADLNRVLCACAWLAGRMERYGYSVPGEYYPAALVRASAEPPGGGRVTSALAYKGERAAVTAVPAEGFDFVSWTEEGTAISGSMEYSFTADRDRELTAVFRAHSSAENGVVGIGRVGIARIAKGV